MIPGFDLGPVLGRGGAGTVYEARQRSTGRSAALKVLEVDVSDPEVLRAFDRERQVMSALAAHPNVVSILDAGVEDGRPWIAMELHPRGSLSNGAPRSVEETVWVVAGIAAALDAAHAQGVVHCDVKPGNILLGDYGPTLADFGIARMGLGTGRTGAAYTLDHAAPEVVAGGRPTPASDVFSLGTTAWQLITGRPPFRRIDDASPAAVLVRLVHDPLPPLGHPGLDRLLGAMTSKDPAARPTARNVRAEIEALHVAAPSAAPGTALTDHRPDAAVLTRSAGSPRLAVAPMSVASPAVPPGRDRVVLVAVTALAVAVLGSGAMLGAGLSAVETVTTSAVTVPTTTSTVPGVPPAVAAPSTPEVPAAVPAARQGPAAAAKPTAPRPAPAVIPPVVAAPPAAVVPAPVVITTTPTTTTTTTTTSAAGGAFGGSGLFPGGN